MGLINKPLTQNDDDYSITVESFPVRTEEGHGLDATGIIRA
jgi:hypothetical protein